MIKNFSASLGDPSEATERRMIKIFFRFARRS